MRLLKDGGIDVHLDLAGIEGDGVGYLLEKIAALGIENEVRYLGSITREEKIRILREYEIYVQPSHFEGFGLATLEAMGCGACVVVCDVGAVREVVGDCGVYVPPNSAEDLAHALKKVLHDGHLRQRLQDSGTRRARELFAFDKKVERLRAFLRDVGVH